MKKLRHCHPMYYKLSVTYTHCDLVVLKLSYFSATVAATMTAGTPARTKWSSK